MKFNIDNNGPDQQTRVWWLNAEGYTVERLFRSCAAAEAWIEQAEVAALAAE